MAHYDADNKGEETISSSYGLKDIYVDLQDG
jgi:hypothetical protein